MAQRISNPAIHHIDKDTGAPLSGGQLFFFEINGTTPKDTFSDEEGTIPNTNPVILDASGVEPDIFGVGSYRVVLQNSVDVQQWERDPVNFETSSAQFSDWLATVDYGVNDIVEASDGNFYSSIQTPNLNNDPTGSPTFWSQTDLLKRWNINETYSTGDPVTALDSSIYISLINNNLGNDPTTDTGVNWFSFGRGGSLNQWLTTFDYAVEAIVEASDGNFYSSIQTPNVGNDPTASPTFWTRFDVLKRWNTNESFNSGDPVTASDSSIYISRINSNSGNDPSSDTGVNWFNSGQMKLLDIQTASASTTIEFTRDIDSTFSYYMVVFTSVFFSVLSDFRLRTSSDGGVNFDFGASDYGFTIRDDISGLNTSTFLGDNTSTFISLGDIDFLGFNSSINGKLEIFNPADTSTPTNFMFTEMFTLDIGSSIHQFGSGARHEANSVNAIQFSPSAGNFISGTFKLYGLL